MRSPTLYSATLLFILQDLYDRLPEVGDLDRPRLVLFLDEAHLLFQDMPIPLLRKFERIVRLIRSKGVALFFATQSPSDLPSVILGQLGNRIQHGLRGATVADQRAIRAAAETMPPSLTVNAAEMIGTLGVGEALVSVVGISGVPVPTELVKVERPALMDANALADEEVERLLVALPRVVDASEALAGSLRHVADATKNLNPPRRGWFARLLSGEL